MNTISLCMIVKDEEKVIGRCLECIKDIVDEIVIVDTGSTDKTIDIVSKYNAKLYHFKWIDNFSEARNFAFDQATKDFIMWLDADDILLDEDIIKLKKMKEKLDSSIDAVSMKYIVGKDEYGNITLSYKRNRLVKRTRNFKWIGAVHEYIAVCGKIIDSDINIIHKKSKNSFNRNIEIYKSMIENNKKFTTRDILYYANELYEHLDYERAIQYYKILLTKDAWVEDQIKACGNLSDCYYFISDYELAREYCFKSFEYGKPRAEQCCRIGCLFLEEKKYELASYWYKTALELEKPENSSGFFIEPCWTWLPHLQLCVCYEKMKKIQLAYFHNEKALKYRPNDKTMLENKKYLQTIM
ncbi:glycosyltransferase [Clostridium sediminicola]|uniref:glycosyltransferase n=1 Tax=Clostridium sediminicola TaxID=3114879 RepID=UPI0031F1F1C0